MEFRDGGDAAVSTSTPHFTAAEDSDDDGQEFLSRTGSFDPYRHIPLRQDDGGEEFHIRFEDTENNHGETPIPDGPDPCAFICAYVMLWLFVLLNPFFGVYQPEIFKLGSNESVLIEPPLPMLMASVKVESIDGAASELMLFGFDKTPPLNIVTSWSRNHTVTLSGIDQQEEWMYFLNNGSKIDISYNVSSLTLSPVYLAISEGPSSLTLTYLFWGPIGGTGEISRYIPKSASYHICVYNMRMDIVEVELKIRIRGLVYDKTNAYFKCTINLGPCLLKIPFTGGNSALLAFPDAKMGIGNNESNVVLSYEPRWITYLIVIGGLMAIYTTMEILFPDKSSRTIEEGESIPLENITRHTMEGESSSQENVEPQIAPLIPQKGDTVAHLGSSQASAGSHNGNLESDHEFDNRRRLCAICFDAPRDCFFLPCGHCLSCYACGTKIVELTGTCPVCRGHVKVKRIYSV